MKCFYSHFELAKKHTLEISAKISHKAMHVYFELPTKQYFDLFLLSKFKLINKILSQMRLKTATMFS